MGTDGVGAARAGLRFRGVGNGVRKIVIGQAIRTESTVRAAVESKGISPQQVQAEKDRINSIRTNFITGSLETETFLMEQVINDLLGNTEKIIEEQLIGAETALLRAINETIKRLETKNHNLTESINGQRELVKNTALTGSLPEIEKKARLAAADKKVTGDTLHHDRSVEFMADIQNMFERILYFLQSGEIMTEGTPGIHFARTLSWPEILRHSGHAAGFVLSSEGQGRASHPVIFSHNHGLALALARPADIDTVLPGRTVALDPFTGEIFVDPDEPTLRLCALRAEKYVRVGRLIGKEHPTTSLDGHPLPRLQCNIMDIADLDRVKNWGDEIGLYRTEGINLSLEAYSREARYPVQILVRNFAKTIRKAGIVNIRLFDVARDKMQDFFTPQDREVVEATGGGINFLFESETGRSIMERQIMALLITCDRLSRAVVDGQIVDLMAGKTVRLIVPMVSTPEQIKRVKGLIERIESALLAKGIIYSSASHLFQVGIMVETSSSLTNLDSLAKESGYFAIGGNDLTSDLLGFYDRKRIMTSEATDWASPIVIKQINKTIRTAKRHGLQVGCCGEMARDPITALLLTLMGGDVLSMDLSYRPEINHFLSQVDFGEWDRFTERDPQGSTVIERLEQLSGALEVRRFILDLIKAACPNTKEAFGNIASLETHVPDSYLLS